MTPNEERELSHAMAVASVKAGTYPVNSGKSCNSLNDAICRALNEMDGGSMYRDDIIALADIGECDMMARAIDRMIARDLVTKGEHNNMVTLNATPLADEWLAEYGKQGRLW